MSVYQILAILRARLGMVFVVFVAALAAATLLLMVVPKRYQGVAQLYVNATENDPVTGAGPSLGVMRGMIYDVMEGLRTRGVALQAVSDLKLDQDPASIAAFQAQGGEGDIRAWLADGLLNRMRAARVGLSSIITITYDGSTAESAARFANAFAQASIRKDIEMRVGPSRDLLDWYDERIKPLREQREKIAAALGKLRRSGQADVLQNSPEAKASLTRELSNAQVELAQARGALQDARAGRLDVSSDAEVATARKQISDLGQQIAQDTATLGAAHNRVRRAIAARARLATRMQEVTERAVTTATRAAEQRVTTLDRRITEINTLVSSGRTAGSIGASDNEREIEALDTQIQQLIQRRELARVSSAIDRSPLRVITEASVPSAPSFPKIPLLAGVAGGLSLFLGVGLAFLREMVDRRIRCPQDIDTYLELTVLSTVPKARVRRRLLRGKRAARPDRSLVGPSPPAARRHNAAAAV